MTNAPGMWQSAHLAPPKPAGMWQSAYNNAQSHAAPPKPATATDPFSSAYEIGKTNLGNTEANTLGNITYGEGSAASDYGYELQRDPTTGAVIGYGVDPNNPFSKMSLLQRAYENQKRHTTNDYAAQGQLYSGALKDAQATDTNDYQHNYSDLTKAFANIIGDFTRQRGNAATDYNNGVGNLDINRLAGLLPGGLS